MTCTKCASPEIAHRYVAPDGPKALCAPCIDAIAQVLPKHIGDVPDLTPISLD